MVMKGRRVTRLRAERGRFDTYLVQVCPLLDSFSVLRDAE